MKNEQTESPEIDVAQKTEKGKLTLERKTVRVLSVSSQVRTGRPAARAWTCGG